MNYFENIKDIAELKKRFRDLAKQFHPDINKEKDGTEIKELIKQFEKMTKSLERKAKTDDSYFQYSAKEEMKFEEKILEKIILLIKLNMKKVNIETIGNWIWVTGETKEYKDLLKNIQMKWHRVKTCWFWNATPYRKKSKKNIPLNEMRKFYGNKKINNKDFQYSKSISSSEEENIEAVKS